MKVDYQKLIDQHIRILLSLQQPSGLFLASKKGTWYEKSWLRDNFYECLAFEFIGDWITVERTYEAIVNIFLKHEYKIDHAIEQKPTESFQYIHARYHPDTFDEFWEEWGNKQNDSIGAILFKLGELEQKIPGFLSNNPDRSRITNKLVKYLESIEYWHDLDAGVWEFGEEIHASSIGACVGGLKEVQKLAFIDVDDDLIRKGEEALQKLLPRESHKHFADLALLSLIYPYNVVTDKQKNIILKNIEYHLLKDRGVIRYKGDHYYNKNQDHFSEEAEWTFGLAWLSIIYKRMGNMVKAKLLLDKLIDLDTEEGIPELYYSNSDKHNPNTPLGWSESLFIVALYEMHTS